MDGESKVSSQGEWVKVKLVECLRAVPLVSRRDLLEQLFSASVSSLVCGYCRRVSSWVSWHLGTSWSFGNGAEEVSFADKLDFCEHAANGICSACRASAWYRRLCSVVFVPAVPRSSPRLLKRSRE